MGDDQLIMRKDRRNGMANIFDGLEACLLEKLGLSEALVEELVKGIALENPACPSVTVTESSADEATVSPCCCERAKLYRSLSATVSEEIQAALQNRHRRNAVGNLFDVLTPSQGALLADCLQVQLSRLNCLCDSPTPTTASETSEVVLSLTDLAVVHRSLSSSSSGSASSDGNSSSGGTSPRSEVVACR